MTAVKRRQKGAKVIKFKQKSKNALVVGSAPNVLVNPIIAMIETVRDAASNPSVNVDKMGKILDMTRQLAKDEAARQYNISMRKTQAEMPSVVKSLTNSQTNSKYAPLEDVQRKCMPIIYANGFSLSFYEEDAPKPDEKRICVDIMHVSGHVEKKHVDLHPDVLGIKGNPNKTPMHADGSTFSYGKRYLTGLVFNIRIVGEDDDGNQGAGEFATDKEVAELRTMLKQFNITEKDAADRVKLPSLDKIPIRIYMQMKIAMDQRRAQQEKSKA